jgi:hypothetical protein
MTQTHRWGQPNLAGRNDALRHTFNNQWPFPPLLIFAIATGRFIRLFVCLY